tara:strand:- start:325 stop:558 length:234 start_codon:yes stop_codon:yes gene_type:complete
MVIAAHVLGFGYGHFSESNRQSHPEFDGRNSYSLPPPQSPGADTDLLDAPALASPPLPGFHGPATKGTLTSCHTATP